MSQTHHPTIPSFLIKLQSIMASDLYTHIIRWDRLGESICIVCVQSLQEVVLPQYFRHAKFSSFVRQLNMYGFHKKKTERKNSAAFYNKYFSKTNIVFSAMSKKCKNRQNISLSIDTIHRHDKYVGEDPIQFQFSTQLDQNSMKISPCTHNQLISTPHKSQLQKSSPEINQLIAELTQKTQSLLSQAQVDWLSCRELQLLLKQPKYRKINYAVLGIPNIDEIAPFLDVSLDKTSSDIMEFIL